MDKIVSKSLLNNKVSLFIIKIDLIDYPEEILTKLIEDYVHLFPKVENIKLNKIEVRLDLNQPKEITIPVEYVTNQVLLNEVEQKKFTFSKSDKSLTFECYKYKNYETYKDIFLFLENGFKNAKEEIKIGRIGMRFVNNFNCNSIQNISKIFQTDISKSIKTALKHNTNLNRLIILEENIEDDCKYRVNYGVPNNSYPAKLNTYNLLLDIDVFEDRLLKVDDLDYLLHLLNKKAYSIFDKFISEKFKERMKNGY